MINRNTVEHIAHLAKLSFTDSELDSFVQEFDSILSMVQELQEVNTEGVQPTFHGNSVENVYRDDVAESQNNSQALLANAPEIQETYIKVPVIIESEDA